MIRNFKNIRSKIFQTNLKQFCKKDIQSRVNTILESQAFSETHKLSNMTLSIKSIAQTFIENDPISTTDHEIYQQLKSKDLSLLSEIEIIQIIHKVIEENLETLSDDIYSKNKDDILEKKFQKIVEIVNQIKKEPQEKKLDYNPETLSKSKLI
jgi:hypothetical protein